MSNDVFLFFLLKAVCCSDGATWYSDELNDEVKVYSEENKYFLIMSIDVRYPHIHWINNKWLFSCVVTDCCENTVSPEVGFL